MSEVVTKLIICLIQDKNLLTPIVLSQNAQDLILQLKNILNSLPIINNSFTEYIIEHVNYHLEVLSSIKNNILIPKLSICIEDKISNLSQNAGVYILHNKDIIDNYIGSSINISNRLIQHWNSFNLSLRVTPIHIKFIELYELKNIYSSHIYITLHYLNDFIVKYPNYKLSNGEYYILQTLTELLPRILEQSLLDNFQPTINESFNVSFKYTLTNWNLSLLDNYNILISNGSKPVEIRNANTNDILYTANSINHASNILNISRDKVSNYINAIQGFYSNIFNIQVTVSFIGIALSAKKIKHRSIGNHSPLSLVNGKLEDLWPGYFWVFNTNKIDYIGPYTNLRNVYRYLYPKHSNTLDISNNWGNSTRKINDYINKDKVIKTEIGNFYVVKGIGKKLDNLPVSPFKSS